MGKRLSTFRLSRASNAGATAIRCLFLRVPEGMYRDLRKASIEAINAVNREEYMEFNDPETLSRISQYELAYRMQISVPDVMNINDEPAYIHELYGTQPGKELVWPTTCCWPESW